MNRPTPTAALAAILLALLLSAPAAAHAELVSSNPEDKAVLETPPTIVTVTFSEALDPERSRFRLVGPAGTVGVGRVGEDPRILVLDGLALGPGEYEIQWTTASADGHIERGKRRFTVLTPTPAPPTASPAPTRAASPPPTATPSPPPIPASTAAPGATGEPTTTGEPGDPAAASGGDVLLPILLALVLVAGVGVAVLRRSRRA